MTDTEIQQAVEQLQEEINAKVQHFMSKPNVEETRKAMENVTNEILNEYYQQGKLSKSIKATLFIEPSIDPSMVYCSFITEDGIEIEDEEELGRYFI